MIYRSSYISGSVSGLQEEIRKYTRCYPNPVNDFLFIDLDIPGGQLELIDMQGKLLCRKELLHGTNSVPVSAYPDGIYLVKILSNQGNAWYKVQKH